MGRLDKITEDSIGNGIHEIKKQRLNDRIFENLLVKGGYYVTMNGIDVEVTKQTFDSLEDGEEVCVIFPSIYYERNGRPILLKELK
jgi:hypothetical protein|tara:strand:- start:750 stop:1007 length:258 start_codon:yes stop_codon:yes gene_type:complete